MQHPRNCTGIAAWAFVSTAVLAGPALAQSEPLKGAAAFGDWRADNPGVSRLIRPEDLPKPGATPSSAKFPQIVHRPSSVLPQVPAGFKIFVHVDGPASPRLIGDHDPVNKTFPTANWLPGEYIRDVYDIDVPLMTTPAGTYHLFFGFWPGGEAKRLKLTQGPNDGADRLSLGTIEIK